MKFVAFLRRAIISPARKQHINVTRKTKVLIMKIVVRGARLRSMTLLMNDKAAKMLASIKNSQ